MKVTLELNPDASPRDLALLLTIFQTLTPEPQQETPQPKPRETSPVTDTKPAEPQGEDADTVRARWAEVNRTKRAQLLIDKGMERSDLRPEYNKYIMMHCENAYGVKQPVELPPDKLASFTKWVEDVQFNPEYTPGSTTVQPFLVSCPF